MNPCIIFLNGPECPAKLQLVRDLRSNFTEDVCIYINRKEVLKMFNAHSILVEESFEWILQKMLKNIVNNGVYIIFDVFLPTRRMNQYAVQLKGLPCYWLGVFLKDISEDFSKDFYDFSIVLDTSLESFSSEAFSLFDFVDNSVPVCFEANKIVEKKSRRRLIAEDFYSNKEDIMEELEKKLDDAFEMNELLEQEDTFEINESTKDGDESVGGYENPTEDDENKPLKEGGDRPFRSPREGGDRPFRREGGDRPFRAPREGGDRPFRAPREGGDRPFRAPREGGDRPFRAPREGGDRPFRAPREGGDRPFRAPREGGDRPFRAPREGGDRPFRSGGRSSGRGGFSRGSGFGKKPS